MYKVPDETIKELLVDKGMTDAQAAEELGISRMSVSRRRSKLGISKKPKRPEGYYGITPDQDSRLHELYSQGMNDYEVAKIMKFGRNRLREWREKNKIPPKTNKKGLGHREYADAKILRESGKSYDEVAKTLGVTRSSVSKFMRKRGHKDEHPYRPVHPEWVGGYKLTPIQRSVIVGDLFGDGTLVPTSESSAYYQSSHSNYQEFFIRWKYSVLLPLSSNVGDRKDHSAYSMKTWTTQEIGELHKLFYGTGKKVLSWEACNTLDELSLAVWFMGDGSLGRKVPYIHLGKHVDAQLLSDFLNNKFSLMSYVREYEKENHLVLDGTSFFKLVNKYILPQFLYKTVNSSCGEYWKHTDHLLCITSDQYSKSSPEIKDCVLTLLMDYYRKKGFPYPRCNKNELRSLSRSFGNNNTTSGYKICNHYMPHRFDAKRYDSTPMKHWNEEKLFKKFMVNRLRYSSGYVSDASIRTGMQLKGVPANFSPAKAKIIYGKYLPAKGSTLDFSSGYGGRLLGFMASSKDSFYTGVDPSSKSCDGLSKMRDECSEFFYGVDPKNINIIRMPFEDVSSSLEDSSFDLVFSSPPYFGLEIYVDEGTQSISRYPEYDKWLESFWFFIIRESFRVLKPGGYFIYTIGNYKKYNLVEDTLEYIEGTKFIRRGFDQLSYKNVFKNSEKKETIFIFKKPA